MTGDELQEVPERLTLLVRGGWWLCYAFTGILQAQFRATSVLEGRVSVNQYIHARFERLQPVVLLE